MTAREMWLLFKKKNSINTDTYEVWAFGDEPDELARLVLEGKKTATASVYDLYGYDNEPLPKAGEYSVIIDSQDRAVCVIRDTEVAIVPFKDVDDEQAYREGPLKGFEGGLQKDHSLRFTALNPHPRKHQAL